jgi:hypothetical protein
VSKTLRPLSISRQTALMFSQCTKIFPEQRPVDSVTSKGALLNQHWQRRCFQAIEGEKHNDWRKQRSRYSEPAG